MTEADGVMRVLDPALARQHHLLVVADDVRPDEVEALAESRFRGAARRDARTIDLLPGAWLEGPWELDPAAGAALGLPAWAARAFLTRCPVRRGDPVPPALLGLGGILDAFSDGPPVEEEHEVVEFLQAAARRLGGAVRFAGRRPLLVPDPAAGVDLRVHSGEWLNPDALLRVLRPVLPGLALLTDAGPAPTPRGSERPSAATDLDEAERAWLHAEADAFDARALAEPDTSEGYGALSRFGDGGVLSVTVEADERPPVVLEGTDWVRSGVVTYELRWYPADVEGYARGLAGAAVLAQRAESGRLIEASARALLEAVGGAVTDDDGFLVAPGA